MTDYGCGAYERASGLVGMLEGAAGVVVVQSQLGCPVSTGCARRKEVGTRGRRESDLGRLPLAVAFPMQQPIGQERPETRDKQR